MPEAGAGTRSQIRLALCGDLDMATVDEMTAECLRMLGYRPARLVLDFAAVRFCDAAGLGALTRVYLDCLAAGCQLSLVNVAPEVRRVMRIGGVEPVLAIEDDPPGGPAPFIPGG